MQCTPECNSLITVRGHLTAAHFPILRLLGGGSPPLPTPRPPRPHHVFAASWLVKVSALTAAHWSNKLPVGKLGRALIYGYKPKCLKGMRINSYRMSNIFRLCGWLWGDRVPVSMTQVGKGFRVSKVCVKGGSVRTRRTAKGQRETWLQEPSFGATIF